MCWVISPQELYKLSQYFISLPKCSAATFKQVSAYFSSFVSGVLCNECALWTLLVFMENMYLVIPGLSEAHYDWPLTFLTPSLGILYMIIYTCPPGVCSIPTPLLPVHK
ncbi:hypothetical protein ILYODFUR_037672 [Ilyodon furcidens]|uniref:Uncharacterized protein n=1 Tax=Ilyodon furcidens TaxID=33524 RepID=A0ABV0U113_9TELE